MQALEGLQLPAGKAFLRTGAPRQDQSGRPSCFRRTAADQEHRLDQEGQRPQPEKQES